MATNEKKELSSDDIRGIADSMDRVNKMSGDFFQNLKESLDLVRQIKRGYGDIADKLGEAKSALKESLDLSNKLETEIVELSAKRLQLQNDIAMSNDYTARLGELIIYNERKILENSEKIKELSDKIVSNEIVLVGIKEDLVKNEKLRTELSEKAFKNEAEKLDLSKKLMDIERSRMYYESNGLADGEEYLGLLKEKVKLEEKQRLNSLEKEVIAGRQSAIEMREYELLGRKAEINRDLTSIASEKAIIAERNNELESKNLEILKDIEITEEEIGILESTRNGISEDINKKHRELTSELSKQQKLMEIITKLSRQLMFYKLIDLGVDRFIELDKAAEEFRKTTGFTNDQMVELRKDAEAVNKQFVGMGIKIDDVYKSATALVGVFGRTSLVSAEALKNVSLMAVNLGVVESDAADVLAIFQGIGGATEESAMNVLKVGAGISKSAGVSFKAVMGDIAKASGTTAMLLGTNPSSLMKAAIAARALGTDLNKLAAQQEKLLNYSSSINDELEASALLGRGISFQKARQLAYEGKVEDSAKATLETVRAAGDFNEMSIYQRKALAAAAGIELSELTKMMAVENRRNAILNGSDEAKKEVLKKQEAELKALKERNKLDEEDLVVQNKKALEQERIQGLMTQFKNIMDALRTAFADILEPIITPAAKILVPLLKSVGFLLGGIAKLIGWLIQPISWVVDGISSLFDSTSSWEKSLGAVKEKFKDIGTGALTLLQIAGAGVLTALFFGSGGAARFMSMLKAPFELTKDYAKDLLGRFGKKGAGAAADMIGPQLPKGVPDATKGVTEAAKGTEKVPAGTGIKEFLSNLADGLKKMAGGEVLKGALNLIPASIGLIAMIPGFVGAKLLEKIDGKALKVSLEGLADGLTKMGTGQVLLGSLALLATAAALVVMIPGLIGMGGIALLGEAFSVGLIAMSTGLSALGGNPMAWLGIAAIAALSLSFIGFGVAAKLVSEAFVNIAKTIPDLIEPLAELAMMTPLLYASAAGIGALAIAFGAMAVAAPGILVAGAAIATISVGALVIGKAFDYAGKGAVAFGKGIKTSIDPIKQLATANLKDAATGLVSLSAALSSFGVGSAVAGIGSFIGNFLGGDPIEKMERLANISDRLKTSADAISAIATATSRFSTVDSFAKSVGVLADSLNRLSDSLGKIKTEELSKLTAIGTAAGAAKPAEATPAAPAMNTTGIENKLDKLTELLVGGAVRVYVDGKNMSSTLTQYA